MRLLVDTDDVCWISWPVKRRATQGRGRATIWQRPWRRCCRRSSVRQRDKESERGVYECVLLPTCNLCALNIHSSAALSRCCRRAQGQLGIGLLGLCSHGTVTFPVRHRVSHTVRPRAAIVVSKKKTKQNTRSQLARPQARACFE